MVNVGGVNNFAAGPLYGFTILFWKGGKDGNGYSFQKEREGWKAI